MFLKSSMTVFTYILLISLLFSKFGGKFHSIIHFLLQFYKHFFPLFVLFHFKSNQVLVLIILHSGHCHFSGCKFKGHLSNKLKFLYCQKQVLLINFSVTAKTIANKLTGDGFTYQSFVMAYSFRFGYLRIEYFLL